MTTWLSKLLAQFKFAPGPHPSIQGGTALCAAVLPMHGTRAPLETVNRATASSSPAGRACTPSSAGKSKPLRIIEWVESASAHHPSSRRMVMSGRLADICAELDRLAALEA